LVLAAIYAGFIIIKGSITVFDSVILFALFGVYVWLSRKKEHESTDLVGPAKSIASLGVTGRRVVVVSVFVYSILLILFSTELFADGLIETGSHFGINEFILIQWLAPLASESPEMLIAVYFALKGSPRAALTMLISATVNQWTLLVGSLPIAYSFGFGSVAGLPLTTGDTISFIGNSLHRQQVELFLTIAQTILAISLVLRLYASWQGMGLLLVFFVLQLLFSGTDQRLVLSFVAFLIAATLIIVDRQRRDQIGVTSKYLLTMLGLRSSV
jgi:cation:H+ antiporter